MSFKAVDWVLDHSAAEGSVRLVALVLAENADQDTGECYPTVQTIARRARVSERTARNALRGLEELDELHTRTREGKGKRADRRSNLYVLVGYLRSRGADIAPRSAGHEGQPAPDEGQPTTGTTGSCLPVEPSLEPSVLEPSAATAKAAASVPCGTPEDDSARAALVTSRSTAGKALRASGDRPRARTPRDDLFDALVAAFGPASTPSRASFYGRTVNELTAAEATPDQVTRARIAMSRRGWNDPTPEAMVKHWDQLLAESRPPEGTNPAARRFWEETA